MKTKQLRDYRSQLKYDDFVRAAPPFSIRVNGLERRERTWRHHKGVKELTCSNDPPMRTQ
jgi:hypothetical protein